MRIIYAHVHMNTKYFLDSLKHTFLANFKHSDKHGIQTYKNHIKHEVFFFFKGGRENTFCSIMLT